MMEDYDQYVDIEMGYAPEKQVMYHHVIDINETFVESFEYDMKPIYFWPLAFNYLVYCIRRILQ